MKKFVVTALITSILLFGIGTSAKAVELIVNGSFEDVNNIYPPVPTSNLRIFKDADQLISGWKVTSGSVDWHNYLHLSPAKDGEYIVDLNGENPGTLAQSFETNIGQKYLLSFYLASGIGYNTDILNVNLAGADYQFGQAGSDEKNLQWGLKTIEFVANSGTTTLAFTSINATEYWGALIDNVSVLDDYEPIPSSTPVPEPSTTLLSIMGFISAVGLKKKKTLKIIG